MMYVKQPAFWIAVIIVAVAVNFAWNLLTRKGKLV
jgi:hypothetical protein